MYKRQAYSGLVINPRSKNQELMLEYLNWVYASKENYELCAYGIEGEDWIRVGEDEFSYPSESYITKPSYSGTLKLLENKNISDRTYTGYTAACLLYTSFGRSRSRSCVCTDAQLCALCRCDGRFESGKARILRKAHYGQL